MTVQLGIRTTTLARTILDCAPGLSDRQLIRDADTLVAGHRTLRLTWERMTRRAAQVAHQLRQLLGLAV